MDLVLCIQYLCQLNHILPWLSGITFFEGLSFPGLAASHCSKHPPSLSYWLIASPQLNSVRWCWSGGAKRENRFCLSQISKNDKFDGARCLFSKFLRLQDDHHCACAQKWCHFYFLQEFQTKKIKVLRPKMTKIASMGACLEAFSKLGLQQRFGHRLPSILLQTLYFVCIRHRARVCFKSLECFSQGDVDRRERLQRSAGNLIVGRVFVSMIVANRAFACTSWLSSAFKPPVPTTENIQF